MNLKDLIEKHEDRHLEFKETLCYDADKKGQNDALKKAVVKEICAMANNEGGKIIIGVTDDHEVKGIKRDLSTMNHGLDSFERMIHQLVTNHISKTFASRHVTVKFKDVKDKQIAIVEVEKGHRPVYLDGEFYIRDGSASRPTTTEEAVDYIKERFNKS